MKTDLQKQQKLKLAEWIPIALLSFQLLVVPLVVRMSILAVHGEVLPIWNNKENWDFFSYQKSIFTYASSGLILVALVNYFIGKKQKGKSIAFNSKALPIAVLVYTASVLVSVAFSPYPHTALWGFPDRHEGAFLILSYLVLFLGAMYLVEKERGFAILLRMALAAAAIASIIGLFQFFGMDLFQSEFGKSLFIPERYQELSGYLRFQTEERLAFAKAIYSTMMNPNTFGLYMALVFPIACTMALFEMDGKYRRIYAVISCLTFAGLIGSFSRGAYVGTVLSVIITGILFRGQFALRRLTFARRSLLGWVGILVLIFLLMNAYSQGTIQSKLGDMTSKTETHAEDLRIDKIKDFKIEGNQLFVYCTNSTLRLAAMQQSLRVMDDQGQSLELTKVDDAGRYRIEDPVYTNYELTIIDNMIKIKKGKSFLFFGVRNDRFEFLDFDGTVMELQAVESFGFERIERIGSGRGYIWSRTLPLMKNNLLVGTGPDTFALVFPQHDFIGKLNFMYDAYLTIDKPHNMYLQTAINTGLLSLVSLLAIFGYYLVKAVQAYRRPTEQAACGENGMCRTDVGLIVFPGILAYLIAAMFTDSTVSVSPVFWIILGLSLNSLRVHRFSQIN